MQRVQREERKEYSPFQKDISSYIGGQGQPHSSKKTPLQHQLFFTKAWNLGLVSSAVSSASVYFVTVEAYLHRSGSLISNCLLFVFEV